MNIRVQGPDGVILEFPAGTDPGVMKSAMQKRYGGPQQKSIAQTQAMPDTGSASTMDGFLPVDTQGAIAPPQGTGIGEELRRLGRSADDAVRVGANAMTFGLADRFAGAMTGKGTEGERAVTKGSRERLGPVASTAIDIAGGVLPGVGLAKAGITAARAIPQAGLLGRLGAGAVDGAALGAANALGYGEDVQQGALMGGAGGGAGALAGEVLSAGMRGLGRVTRPAAPTAPSLDDLKMQQKAAYQAFDDINPIYDAKELAAAQARLQGRFAEMGADPALQPKAFVALNRVAQDVESGLPVTGKGLETIRKVAGNAYDPMNPSSNLLVKAVQGEIEGIMGNPGAAISGDAKAAADAVAQGRELTKRIKKQEIVDQLLEKASIRADRAGSGGNVDNATRQELSKLLDPKSKQGKMFTEDERGAVRELVKGTLAGNIMRGVGKLSPQGSGLMSALGIGGAVANPLAAIPFALGAAAKPIGDKMTENSARRLGELIRAGGSKEAAFGTPNMLERIGTDNRDAIVRALMMSGAIAAPGIVSNR